MRLHTRAAVLTCAAVLAACGSQPQKAPTPPPVVIEPEPPKVISVAAVGDIMMGTDYPENILPDDDGVGFLANVSAVLSGADVTFGNLEGVLMDGGEAVKRCRPARKAAPAAAPVTPPAPAVPAPQTAPAPVPDVVPPVEVEESADSAEGAPASTPAEGAADTGRSTKEQPPEAASSERTVPIPPGETPATEPAAAASSERAVPTPPAEGLPASPSARGAATDNPSGAQAAVAASSEPTAPRTTAPAAPPPTPVVQQPATGGSCYVFRSPTRYATYLRDTGFDVMSLANNHAQDFGDPGRDSSMRALDDVGIRHSGREGDVAEWEAHGRRIAMVAFAPNVGSHQLNDLEKARAVVGDLAKRHDIVIVSFHGGGEGEGASTLPFAHEIYHGEDRGDVVEFAHTVVDAGADLVIGHGPHVMRPIELYRDRLIAYSLGNFATYYGISVTGIRGISGILTTRLGEDGRFVDARFDSTIQLRPAGPSLDPERRALIHLRDLTTTTFPAGHLKIEDDGRIARH